MAQAVKAPACSEIEVNLRIFFKRRPAENPSMPVWRIHEATDDSYFEHVVDGFTLEHGCYSIYEPAADPFINCHQVGCRGSVVLRGTHARITSFE